MGNAAEKNSSLARNWKPLDSHTYRNTITSELIDHH